MSQDARGRKDDSDVPPSNLQIAVVLGSFLITGLMLYLFFRPVTDAVLQYWPSAERVAYGAGSWFENLYKYYAGVVARGGWADPLTWLAWLFAMLLHIARYVVITGAFLLVAMPVVLFVGGVMLAPQLIVLWLWRRFGAGTGGSSS